MSNSALISCTLLSPHKRPRTSAIKKITIHHAAGIGDAGAIGANFQSPGRVASSNYGIGVEGDIGLFVPEEYRTIASSSTANDNQAVTIEVSNTKVGGDWPVSDASLKSCVALCADICRRNGISRLNYTGDANGNLTRHNMFVATTCPGPYLQSKFPWIAQEVNKLLEEANEVVDTTKIIVNGKPVTVERIFKDGKNYIAIRELEKLGFKVGYDAASKTPVVST